MKIEILSEEKTNRLGTICFGSCVYFNNRYYILSGCMPNSNSVNLIDLSTGAPKLVSIDIKVRVIDAKIIIL